MTTADIAEREAARHPDGKFGSWPASDSGATLTAEKAQAYQAWEDEIGEDLYTYVNRCAEGIHYKRENNIDPVHEPADIAQEVFIQIDRQIRRQAETGNDEVRHKRSWIRSATSGRSIRMDKTTFNYGNHLGWKALDRRIADHIDAHDEEPSEIQRRGMAEEARAEVARQHPKYPPQRDFDQLRRIDTSSLDAPIDSTDDEGAPMSQFLESADTAPEVGPEEAAIYGDAARQASVSATCDALADRALNEKCRGAREAVSELFPDHPVTQSLNGSKGLRRARKQVGSDGSRSAMLAGIETAEQTALLDADGGEDETKKSSPDTAAARAAFSPWDTEDPDKRREIFEAIDEYTEGDEKKFHALWNTCLNASVETEEDGTVK